MSKAPTTNLLRAYARPEAAEYRDGTDGEAGIMSGHFAVFNRWTEIDSWYEGRFLERIAPGAFADTFAERADKIRVLYDHGRDPTIGNKPLGTPDSLREDRTGAYYEVSLFDAPYVDQLRPALRAGQLGASFRFSITGESWVEPSKATKQNPGKLPERTITGVDLYEFGPVTFPAYDDATAGLRSRTDDFVREWMRDPAFVARMTDDIGLPIVEQILAGLPDDIRSPATATPSDEPADSRGAEPIIVGTPALAVRSFLISRRRHP